MTPSLKELRAVTVLADERHFGRAADRLGMLQPQLSQIVARVEASAGFALFHRRPQVAPTIGGAAFIDTCRGILAEFEQGLERARHINAGQEG